MKLRSLFGLLLSMLTVFMFGCGDNGGGGPSSKVSGTAAAGIVSGGTVTFNSIDAAGVVGAVIPSNPSPLTTAPDGTYTATIGYAGPLLVTVTGGTYIDEATGQSVALTTPLRAALPNATGTIVGNVTPLTEVAVQKAGPLTAANITSANTAISSLVGVTDILVTAPADPAYTSALETFSQVQADTGADLATSLSSLSAGITISGNTATVAPATQAIIDTANANIATNPNIAATVVALTASPATGVTISPTPVTISAAVTFVSSGQPVPAGANVNFAITSGTGTLSAASAVTTAGGSASVTLSSTTAGSVVVSAATATSAAATITVPFIDDPNAPGAVQLTASKTLALANGTDTINLTAVVSPAGAGGAIPAGTTVNFTTTVGGGIFSGVTTTGAPDANGRGTATANLTHAAVAAAPFSDSVTVSATAGGASGTTQVKFMNQPVTALVTASLNRALGPISNLTFDILSGDGGTTFVADNIAQNPAPITLAVAQTVASPANTVRVALISLNISITANTPMLALIYDVTAGSIPQVFTVSASNAVAPDGATVVPVAPADFNPLTVVYRDGAGNTIQ